MNTGETKCPGRDATRRFHWLFLGLAFAASVWACNPDASLIGQPVPNSPPETNVSGTPPVPTQTGFEVEFYWNGSDPDGVVVGYEWRISDNGPDQMVDPEDTLEVDLPWHYTTVTDSTFEVSADLDSFPADVDDPLQGPRNYRYWQSHTFFVRSVDDAGARDTSPAHFSFTATTLAPRVTIDLPVYVPSTNCRSSAKVLTFGWTGTDADHVTQEPSHVRYLFIPSENPANNDCWVQVEYEDQQPPLISNDDPAWSEWIPYDAPEDAGRRITLERQDAGKTFLFAVQARDVAGAVTPTFDWGVNVRHVKTTNGKFPELTVSEPFLGERIWSDRYGTIAFEIVSGQPLRFRWSADASSYAGLIEAYRYGWDLVDPDDPNDPGWEVPWGSGPNWRQAPERSFQQGTHNFVVQCRDNSGTITRAVYTLQVIQIQAFPLQRPLLLVDDWKNGPSATGRDLDVAWDREWNDLLSARVPGFQPGDVIDAESEPLRLTFRTINDYRAVIWFISPSNGSFFQSNLAPSSNTTLRYNWLEVYQARVGNLLMAGPGSMVNSVEDIEWVFPMVFNTSFLPPHGFGVDRLPDGSTRNRGIQRWPYTAWCLDLVDTTRPPPGFIWGEDVFPFRDKVCDQLIRAELDPDFLSVFPDAGPPADVRTLDPDDRRTAGDSRFLFVAEEFYNTNVTTKAVSLVLRDCQVPMFRFQARRDDPDQNVIADPPNDCWPRGVPTSKLDNTPVALASQVYGDTKQQRGASDFLWGFHPLAFDRDDMSAALFWILKFNWGLPVQ